MKVNTVQTILASFAILTSAAVAEVLRPQELMAASSSIPNLEEAIPRQFGQWRLVPNMGLVKPDQAGFVDDLSSRIYSQEVGRAYRDNSGNVIMLLIAYGPVQNYRLKAHLPEVCYSAAGFRVSKKSYSNLSYRVDAPPLVLSRLIAAKEGRFEPISYWMRVGNDLATGIFDRQMLHIKYGIQGKIPDGALFRVSTVGLSQEVAYPVQNQFIRDLVQAIAPEQRKFFVGS